MKLKTENGMVTFIMRAGKNKVKSKMPSRDVANILNGSHDVVETDTEIIVDDKYFFPAEPKKKSRKKNADEVSENE